MCQHEFRNSEWTDIQIQITSRNLGNAKKKDLKMLVLSKNPGRLEI